MDWKVYAVIAMIFGALSPFLGSKAVLIHGQKTHYAITSIIILVIATYCLLTNGDGFSKVTKISFFCALASAALGTTAFLLIAHTWQTVPQKIPLVMIILSFSATLNAVIGHLFFDNHINLRQWLCFIGAFLLIAIATWKE